MEESKVLDKNYFIQFLISRGALKFGDFTTKSGRRSPYFINMGEFGTGEAIDRLGYYYASHIAGLMETGEIPRGVNNLFGPAYKGIPLCVSAAAQISRAYGINIAWSFNRKEAKDHGEGGNFVGTKPKDGDKILILDDVITAGTAMREVLPLLVNAADVKVAGLIVAVDRVERGQTEVSAVAEVERDFGVLVFPIITVRDIIAYLKCAGDSAELILRIEDYLRDYGVE
jgi:orotate phosphoribosyltransferase